MGNSQKETAKVKLSLLLINHAAYHEDVWGSISVIAFFSTRRTECKWSASRRGRFTPWTYPLLLIDQKAG
jgi:hypothetical protein